MSGHDYFDCVPFYLPLVFFLASASSKMAARKREGAWAGSDGSWVKWVVGGGEQKGRPSASVSAHQALGVVCACVCVCVHVRYRSARNHDSTGVCL